jgi:hypothetical protein
VWTFVATDLAGNRYGELRQATERHLRFPLDRLPTFTFTIDVDNPAAPWVAATHQTLIQGYDDESGTKVLRYQGPIVGYKKRRDGSGGQLEVSSAGIGWRLQRRLIGMTGLVAVADGATMGSSALALVDRGEIAGRIIDALNAGDAGGSAGVYCQGNDTGIRRGTITNSASDYVLWRYKKAMDAILELSAPLDGFDWEIAPVPPTPDSTGVQLGALNISPLIGTPKLNAAWEFGTGRRNVESWEDLVTAEAIMNAGSHLPADYPANNEVVSWVDTASFPGAFVPLARYGGAPLYEDIVSGDVTSSALRLKLVQEHIALRKVPQRVIAVNPIALDSSNPVERRLPIPFVDFIVGDFMPFRAVETYRVRDSAGTVVSTQEAKTVDALMRLYALDLTIDDAGQAAPGLTLVQEG